MNTIRTLPRAVTAGCAALGGAMILLAGCSPADDAAAGEHPRPAPCAHEAADNPLTGDRPIPVHFAGHDAGPADTEVGFHYTVMAGAPDPCTPLSWVELAGTNGVGGPGATAGSNRETVVLFGDGRLITDPAPILARRIDGVDRLDAATVRVHYAFYDGPAASGRTAPGSATFHWDGSRIIVTDDSLPPGQTSAAETLELDHVPDP